MTAGKIITGQDLDWVGGNGTGELALVQLGGTKVCSLNEQTVRLSTLDLAARILILRAAGGLDQGPEALFEGEIRGE